MTHEEAFELLAGYALDALDEGEEALRDHLVSCAVCRAALTVHLEAAAALAGAVEPVTPPAGLRATVLGPASGRARPPIAGPMPSRSLSPMLRAAAIVLLAVGLGGWGVHEHGRARESEERLRLAERGLALLTSTETTSARLNPVTASGERLHGHWFHRDGVATQVLVIEFMPPPANGEAYYGWMREEDGAWRACGSFALDGAGYGRLVLTGEDGSRVRSVRVTRQSGPSAAPTGEAVLQTAP